MDSIDCHNLKKVCDNSVQKSVKHGFNLDGNPYSNFNIKNWNAPELYPIVDLVQYVFKLVRTPTKYDTLKKIKKYQGCDYTVRFKTINSDCEYQVIVSKDFSTVKNILKDNRRIDMNDYLEMLNDIYLDINTIKKIVH